MEQFLNALDGSPLDWRLIYGHGHHDLDFDERLFTLNQERDAKRTGNKALQWTVDFLWSAELSRYDSTTGRFSLAIGPTFTPTRWDVVRFKPEEVPSNLVVIPDPAISNQLLNDIVQVWGPVWPFAASATTDTPGSLRVLHVTCASQSSDHLFLFHRGPSSPCHSPGMSMTRSDLPSNQTAFTWPPSFLTSAI